MTPFGCGGGLFKVAIQIDVAIIGAGPTGLGAGFRLRELGERNFLIFESEDRVGGLSASFRDEKGFVWDLGGHIHFSHYPRYSQIIDDALGAEGWIEHVRDSRVRIRDRYVPYPIQEHLHCLPGKDKLRCMLDLIKKRCWPGRKTPRNFNEWVLMQFGETIAELFFTPYNLKVWATPLELMGTSWLADRVASVSFGQALRNILFGQDSAAWGPNKLFKYPKEGGTGSLWEKISSKVGRDRIKLNEPVRSIDLERKELITSAGAYRYKHLINTSPLPLFLEMAEGFSDGIKNEVKNLRSSTIHVVGLGIEGAPPKSLQGVGWIYFPDADIPFFRATVLSNHSPYCVPRPGSQWALLLEVSNYGREKIGKEELIRQSIQAVRRFGYLEDETKLVSVWYRKCANAYPVPTLSRDQILKAVELELAVRQVFTRGRLGGWKYEVGNQDHCFMQGMEVIDRIKSGKPEGIYYGG